MDLTEKDLEWTFDIEKSEEMFLRDIIPLNWFSEHKYRETNVVEREYFVKPGATIPIWTAIDNEIHINIKNVTIQNLFKMNIDRYMSIIHLYYNGFVDITDDDIIIRFPSYLRKSHAYWLYIGNFCGTYKVTYIPAWIVDATNDVMFKYCGPSVRYNVLNIFQIHVKAYIYVLNTGDANCILDTFTCTIHAKSSTILQTIDVSNYVDAENHPLEEVHCYTIDLRSIYVDMHALPDVKDISIHINTTKLPSASDYNCMVEIESELSLD